LPRSGLGGRWKKVSLNRLMLLKPAARGADSGRQRRQGPKPASCAAAAEAKKRQFSNFGVRAGQIGRQ